MLRALRLLLATALAFPAPGWAAGNVRVQAPVSLPAGPIAAPTGPLAGLPALPAGRLSPGLQTPAALPALPALSRAAGASTRVVAAESAPEKAQSALQRLRADIPFAAPQAGDVDGAKSFADKSFDFKVGAQSAGEGEPVVPEAGRGGGGGGTGGGGGADDGGGDNYPSRSVRFWGKLFRRTLFRPNVPVEPEIIRAIDTAKKSIHIAVYEFKLPGILDALRRARDRGVEVRILLDYSSTFPRAEAGADYKPRRSREIWALLREGFDVKILRGMSEFGINHNKFAVFDHGEAESMVVFGSYNWSRTAEEDHYENANFSNNARRVDALKAYWDWMDSMAVPERQARDHQWPSTLPAPPIAVDESVAFNGIKLPPVVLSPTLEAGKSIEDRVVQAIDASEKSIEVAAFAVRSTRIAEALARAKARKVKVRVIMDKSQSESDAFGLYARWLASQGIEIRLLAGPDPNADFQLSQKHHHKFMIFDGTLVETGSANFTKYGAATNFENSHFLDEQKDADAYSWIYQRMWKRAAKLDAPAQAPALPSDAELAADARKPVPPHPRPNPYPGPTDPSIKARPIAHNGKTLPSYAFRPDTPVEPLIIEAIDSAKVSIRMALYEFKLPGILEALRRAQKRGIRIELILDRSHVYTTGKDSTSRPRKPSAEILALINEGFDVLVLKGEKGGIMHNKFLVVDAEKGEDGLVQYGSYNYAPTAEHNHFENVMFTDDKHAVADYVAYFDYMRGLADAVDHDKLDEVLNRGVADAEQEEAVDRGIATGLGPLSAELEARGSEDPRDSKNPPPPASTGAPILFNGETFDRRYFSPQGGVLAAWIKAINAAEKSIDIAMFGFYSREVAEAIVARVLQAKKDGTQFEVRMALDAGQSTLAKIDETPINRWFAERGVSVRMVAGPNEEGDPMYEKQHNKFMLVDGRLLLTGSFNLSPTAENLSFENANLVDDAVDLAGFVEYFMRMFSRGWPPRVSAALQPPAPGSSTSSFNGF